MILKEDSLIQTQNEKISKFSCPIPSFIYSFNSIFHLIYHHNHPHSSLWLLTLIKTRVHQLSLKFDEKLNKNKGQHDDTHQVKILLQNCRRHTSHTKKFKDTKNVSNLLLKNNNNICCCRNRKKGGNERHNIH